MEDIILIGGGGHCKSVIDTLQKSTQFNIKGIIDLKEKVGSLINDVKIIGDDNDLEKIFKNGIKYAFITIGSIGNPAKRIQLFEKAKKIGFKFPCIIDSTAIIARNVIFDEGTFVGKRVIINSNTKVGRNCIINSGAIIEHDCQIGDDVHIAPGVVLSGNVYIGINTHVGTNSTIIQGIKIGKNTLIGAGSVLVKNISKNKKAYGNPCKEVENIE